MQALKVYDRISFALKKSELSSSYGSASYCWCDLCAQSPHLESQGTNFLLNKHLLRPHSMQDLC